MKADNLKSVLKMRLELYGLNGHVDWERSRFRQSVDGNTLTAEFVIGDSSWLGAVAEVVKERCKQLEQKFGPTNIQAFFLSVWILGRLRRIGDTAKESEGGVPLRPAIRYLAILKSGAAQISAIVDVQRDDDEEPRDETVRQFLQYRLSIHCDDVWNPETESLLLVGLDAVKYYAGIFKTHHGGRKTAKPKR